MTPAARILAAINILEGLAASAVPADRYLSEWARANRFAGSADRRAIAALVYRAIRLHGYLAAASEGSATPRENIIALLAREGMEEGAISAVFNGMRHAPAPLTADERKTIARAKVKNDDPRENVPAFLVPELERSLGDALADELRALEGRAQLWVRVNESRMSRDAAMAALRQLGIDAAPDARAPRALRLSGETAALERHALFTSGALVVQDLASQIAAAAMEAKPGMRLVDLCAGAGGKSLALAANMEGKGTILACDVDGVRLERLTARAAAAGASNITTCVLARNWLDNAAPHEAIPENFRGSADGLFIDAPCSGSGVWRRNPEAKWRLSPSRLADLNKTQSALLKAAAHLVKPGGRVLYATCSILRAENEDVAASAPASLQPLQSFRLSPARDGTDGFFVSTFTKTN
ncbi:MAG TPA: RsmB/NOP family class I SAM-dependent RNA methyltransferase [Micropepsaceae bacterium]|nr:RsmB/NOP family class I SAM-dependent RNA methyltransferase [Micropepsaceae bacterium]